MRDEIKKGSLVLIGSPKGNPFTDDLMFSIARHNITLPYTMRLDEYEIEGKKYTQCYLHSAFGANKLYPDKTDEYNLRDGKKGIGLTDYSVILKLPNIFMKDSDDSWKRETIFLLAGCKAGGQIFIREWFFSPDNFMDLVSEYSEKYFCLIYKVHYDFKEKGLPSVDLSKCTCISRSVVEV